MQSYAFGEVGMARMEFWKMTPREFWNACKGHNEKVNREIKLSWEQTRWLGAVQANSFRSKPIQPKQLLSLPWDTEKAIDLEEEARKIKEYEEKWQIQ